MLWSLRYWSYTFVLGSDIVTLYWMLFFLFTCRTSCCCSIVGSSSCWLTAGNWKQTFTDQQNLFILTLPLLKYWIGLDWFSRFLSYWDHFLNLILPKNVPERCNIPVNIPDCTSSNGTGLNLGLLVSFVRHEELTAQFLDVEGNTCCNTDTCSKKHTLVTFRVWFCHINLSKQKHQNECAATKHRRSESSSLITVWSEEHWSRPTHCGRIQISTVIITFVKLLNYDGVKWDETKTLFPWRWSDISDQATCCFFMSCQTQNELNIKATAAHVQCESYQQTQTGTKMASKYLIIKNGSFFGAT